MGLEYSDRIKMILAGGGYVVTSKLSCHLFGASGECLDPCLRYSVFDEIWGDCLKPANVIGYRTKEPCYVWRSTELPVVYRNFDGQVVRVISEHSSHVLEEPKCTEIVSREPDYDESATRHAAEV